MHNPLARLVICHSTKPPFVAPILIHITETALFGSHFIVRLSDTSTFECTRNATLGGDCSVCSLLGLQKLRVRTVLIPEWNWIHSMSSKPCICGLVRVWVYVSVWLCVPQNICLCSANEQFFVSFCYIRWDEIVLWSKCMACWALCVCMSVICCDRQVNNIQTPRYDEVPTHIQI